MSDLKVCALDAETSPIKVPHRSGMQHMRLASKTVEQDVTPFDLKVLLG
jgi:hypothetical protein